MLKFEYNEAVNIETENPGVLEVPEGKNVEDLPIKHFVDIANRKGLATVTRALNNLQVWNKNKNKSLSKWARDMIDKVSKRFENQKKNESLNYIKENVYDSIVNLPEKEFIDQLAFQIASCYDPTDERIIVYKLEKGRNNAIDGLEFLLPSYEIRDIMDTIHQRSETISTTNDPYEFENYFYDKVMDKTLDYVIDNEKVSRKYHITTESSNESLIREDVTLDLVEEKELAEFIDWLNEVNIPVAKVNRKFKNITLKNYDDLDEASFYLQDRDYFKKLHDFGWVVSVHA